MPRRLPVTTENQWFQRAEVLKRNRQKRWHHRQFFVEGVRSINRLRVDRRWQVEALLYTPERRLSGWARDVLAEIPAPLHLELSAPLMDKLSDKEDASEVIALVKMPDLDVSAIPRREDALVLVFDRPGNLGNLGSILRSADAFGAHGVVLTGHSVDVFDPAVIRASAGAFFSMPVASLPATAALDAWLTRFEQEVPGLRIVGTSAKAPREIGECALGGPVVLCFGNEATGLSQWLKGRCHALAGIPMQGVASSLNLACAVTVVLYETRRQRQVPGDG